MSVALQCAAMKKLQEPKSAFTVPAVRFPRFYCFFRAKTKFSIFSLLATASSLLALDPLHPNISMHIQHSILYTFPEVLMWRQSRAFITQLVNLSNQIQLPIISRNSNLDIGKLTRLFFAYFSFRFRGVLVSCFLSFRLHKIVTLLFEILRSFGVLILAKYCGSFNKCNKYFLRRLDLKASSFINIFFTLSLTKRPVSSKKKLPVF